ncbi:hypothetical protein [Salirhabdus salicampi]|uniref:hypothetical protein n=1 Tax=Salirhabdus salicampi TaxID=476102 RepID=UPI0020C55ACC|nr:hypothetical protein [Salirhabdus salicampi]MCP8617946.1 hypothetical protein [Salirhabdus salicampi]
MKTSLIYVLLNALLYPVVITLMFVGFLGGALTNGNLGFGNVIWLYLIALLPNMLSLLVIHFWGYKWNLNKKVNAVMFLLFAFILAYFVIMQPLEIQNIFK